MPNPFNMDALSRRDALKLTIGGTTALWLGSSLGALAQSATTIKASWYGGQEVHTAMQKAIAVFTEVLESAGTMASAGMSVPAALADSHDAVRQLAAWAREREHEGAAPVTIRLTDSAGSSAATGAYAPTRPSHPLLATGVAARWACPHCRRPVPNRLRTKAAA